jgi:transcriptional regulator with XRE-family HTH domain
MKKNPDLVKFGLNVRRIRLKKGLSQSALAKQAGLSPNYIGTLERGVQNPSLKTLERLAKGLGCSMSETCKGIK